MSLLIGFFVRKIFGMALEWGSQLLQKCCNLIGWKISTLWWVFPSDSKWTTTIYYLSFFS
jgi:hypothetical protein